MMAVLLLLISFQDFCNQSMKTLDTFRHEIAAYRKTLKRIPAELAYLTTCNDQLQGLKAFVAKKPEISPAQRILMDRCQSMATVAEFRDRTNIADLVNAVWSSQIDCPPDESVDEAIAAIFQTYVPITIAWYVTLLRDIRLAAPANSAIKLEPHSLPHDASWRNDVEIVPLDRTEIIDLDADDDVGGIASTQQLLSDLATPRLGELTHDSCSSVAALRSAGLRPLDVRQDAHVVDDGSHASNCEEARNVVVLVTDSDSEPLPGENADVPVDSPVEAQQPEPISSMPATTSAPTVQPPAAPVPPRRTANKPISRSHNRAHIDADRTVILQHDFAPLTLVRHTNAGAGKPAAAHRVSPKRTRAQVQTGATAAATAADVQTSPGRRRPTIEDASEATSDDEDTHAKKRPRRQAVQAHQVNCLPAGMMAIHSVHCHMCAQHFLSFCFSGPVAPAQLPRRPKSPTNIRRRAPNPLIFQKPPQYDNSSN